MPATDEQILSGFAYGLSDREVCRELHVGDKRVSRLRKISAVQACQRLPEPAPESGGPKMPESLAEDTPPLQLSEPGHWLVLSDVHLPHHDKTTCELAINEARRCNAAGVFLNGDILDSGEISDHKKHKSDPRYRDELEMGRQFLRYLRSRMPKARIIYKQGNHELRLSAYVVRNAPALEGVPGVSLPEFLSMKDYGVEWVGDMRVVRLGKLNVVHGHEYRGGVGGVSPARWLWLKARAVAMCGHFHRSGDHFSRNILNYNEGAWSVGCACYLHPEWLPLNDWNHGFAMVELAGDGNFKVRNLRVLNGEVV